MTASSVKISISVPPRDIELIDRLRASGSYPSTSAVIHAALERFREEQLDAEYAEAFADDTASEWAATEADGWR